MLLSKKYYRFLFISLFTISCLVVDNIKLSAQNKLLSEVHACLKNLPFSMHTIQLPKFPKRIFNIKTYGAVGDGHTINTRAIDKAIENCSEAGGGEVLIPPGLWLTGPIELKSNVNLHAAAGALILFSKNHTDYPIIKPPHRGYSTMNPIYGVNLINVAITGRGVFDGNGQTWRPVKKNKVTESHWKALLKSGGILNKSGTIWYPSKAARDGKQIIRNLKEAKKKLTAKDCLPVRDYLRPYMVLLLNCKNVLLEGITVKNSPKFALYPTLCTDLVITDVKINNEYWAQNGDAIDINTCKNVLVYKNIIHAGDDGICMKSNDYKKSSEPGLKNVVITDNIVYHAHGGFVTGSNTDGGMRNIFVDNNDFIGTDVGLRFKSARGRGGLVDSIYIRNIFMKDIVREAILFNTYYENDKNKNEVLPVTKKTPIFKNIFIDSIYVNGASQAVSVNGLPEMSIKNIYISNSFIQAKWGFKSDFAKGFKLKNVTIIPENGNVYTLNNSSGFQIYKAFCPAGTNVFLEVEGNSTKNVRIIDTDLSSAKIPVEYGKNVNHTVVKLK